MLFGRMVVEVVKPIEGRSGRRFFSRIGLSLKSRNIRRFLAAQGFLSIGLWMQQTAELWLILELAGTGTALGFHSLLMFGPLLIFGARAGLMADRFSRIRLLKITQSCHVLLSAGFAGLMIVDPQPALNVVYALVLARGCIVAVDNPVRRGVIRDVATDEELANAVGLNSSVGMLGITIGPPAAGLLVVQLGFAVCFAVCAAIWVAAVVALQLIDRRALRTLAPLPPGRGQTKEGLLYASRTPEIRSGLILVTIVGATAWNYPVVMPVYVTRALDGDAALFGSMLAAVGAGSFIGALAVARATVDSRFLTRATAVSSAMLLVVAVAPTVGVAMASLFALGGGLVAVVVAVQARLQLTAVDQMAGRVMALFSVAFAGSLSVGSALAGAASDLIGPRLVFVLSSAAVGVAAFWFKRAHALSRI